MKWSMLHNQFLLVQIRRGHVIADKLRIEERAIVEFLGRLTVSVVESEFLAFFVRRIAVFDVFLQDALIFPTRCKHTLLADVDAQVLVDVLFVSAAFVEISAFSTAQIQDVDPMLAILSEGLSDAMRDVDVLAPIVHVAYITRSVSRAQLHIIATTRRVVKRLVVLVIVVVVVVLIHVHVSRVALVTLIRFLLRFLAVLVFVSLDMLLWLVVISRLFAAGHTVLRRLTICSWLRLDGMAVVRWVLSVSLVGELTVAVIIIATRI
mmetsp:Transcript_39384/g.62950  ORF Transcript_39384/g.62950 Transcript_39384/m.62950 type:complete len:264 (-) Transcript_39384:1011-1802(-)